MPSPYKTHRKNARLFSKSRCCLHRGLCTMADRLLSSSVGFWCRSAFSSDLCLATKRLSLSDARMQQQKYTGDNKLNDKQKIKTRSVMQSSSVRTTHRTKTTKYNSSNTYLRGVGNEKLENILMYIAKRVWCHHTQHKINVLLQVRGGKRKRGVCATQRLAFLSNGVVKAAATQKPICKATHRTPPRTNWCTTRLTTNIKRHQSCTVFVPLALWRAPALILRLHKRSHIARNVLAEAL